MARAEVLDWITYGLYFSRMIETDATVPLAVENMDHQQFSNYLAERQFAVVSLPLDTEYYYSKKNLLDQAVTVEKNSVEMLRAVSRLTVTNGAVNQDLTVDKRIALLTKLRKNVFSARQHFIYVKSKCLFMLWLYLRIIS